VTEANATDSYRVLVLAPTGRDAQLICGVLQKAQISCREVSSVAELCDAIQARAGAAVLAEEAIPPKAVETLSAVLKQQPPWSDFPILVLTSGGESTQRSKLLLTIGEPLGNVTLIERPVRTETLVSSVQSALRGRSRQYEIEEFLEQEARSEEALRHSIEQFRQLANAMPQLVWMADPSGNIYWYNERWFDYTGTTLNQMRGWGWKSVHDPEILPKVMERWHESLNTGTLFEMEFPIKGADGTFRWFLTRVIPVRDEHGQVVQWFGTNTDIHEQREARHALQEGQARLEAMVEQRTSALRLLSSRLMNSQDEERRRIARELHDSLGQYLAALSMQFSALQASKPDSIAAATAEMEEIIRCCVQECRTISHLLHPPLLDEVGLQSAIQWYVEGFSERSGIEVELQLAQTDRMASEIETTLFRVLQESLTNIHRHAGTRTALVKLEPKDENLVLEISDKGKGIPPLVLEKFRSAGAGVGVGLAGMRERVSQLNGSLRIESDSSGTTVKVSLPIHNSQHDQTFSKASKA
jgi:PAS domain S-box-containing protein